MRKWQFLLLGLGLGLAVAALAWLARFTRPGTQGPTFDEKPPIEIASAPDGAKPVNRGDREISACMEAIRRKYQLPALGGAILTSAGMVRAGVDGTRKVGASAGVAIDDSWHLGSDTKAMTATMIAALVERGKLSWDTTLSSVFANEPLPAATGNITLAELLTHRAGLPSNLDWRALAKRGSLVEQRRTAVARLSATELLAPPGSKFLYSNLGYVVAAAVAEHVTGKSYEELMQEILFAPLNMRSVGFGPTGAGDKVDEPWGHTAKRIAVQADNPLCMAPAGGVHCTLEDWGKFIADQLRGAEGKPALLRRESYTRLQSAPAGGEYAMGWMLLDRTWGGGQVFTHAGSNTFNLAVAWLAPKRDFAVLIVCNQAGSEKACDEAASALIKIYQGSITPSGPPR